MVGALDMGGGSNQLILFTGGEQKSAKTVANNDFWSHSWLNFGAERVHQKVMNFLVEQSDLKDSIILNPCAFAGFRANHSEAVEFVGTGEGVKCLDTIRRTLWSGDELAKRCIGNDRRSFGDSAPCGVDGVATPSVAGSEFFAMSVYFYAFDCVRHLTDHQGFSAWPRSSIVELEAAVLDFCALEWQDVRQRFDEQAHPYTMSSQLSARCLEALYMVLLLEKGFGFHPEERSITYALEVNTLFIFVLKFHRLASGGRT